MKNAARGDIWWFDPLDYLLGPEPRGSLVVLDPKRKKRLFVVVSSDACSAATGQYTVLPLTKALASVRGRAVPAPAPVADETTGELRPKSIFLGLTVLREGIKCKPAEGGLRGKDSIIMCGQPYTYATAQDLQANRAGRLPPLPLRRVDLYLRTVLGGAGNGRPGPKYDEGDVLHVRNGAAADGMYVVVSAGLINLSNSLPHVAIVPLRPPTAEAPSLYGDVQVRVRPVVTTIESVAIACCPGLYTLDWSKTPTEKIGTVQDTREMRAQIWDCLDLTL